MNLKLFLNISKPRIVFLVLLSSIVGFISASKGDLNWAKLFCTALGTSLSCAGACALNNYLEREIDSRMLRTQNRPLPLGLLNPASALMFGIVCVLLGTVSLALFVNILTAFLALLSAFLYVLVYTPLKRITWLNTTVGAIPGALPPLGGWAGAHGELELGAWILFFILFLWQHPHFFAIAWICRDDYERGGIKMLPVVDPSGRSTIFQSIAFSVVLVWVSLLPYFLGMTGFVYLAGSILVALLLIKELYGFSTCLSLSSARRLFRSSLVYLPVVLVLFAIKF